MQHMEEGVQWNRVVVRVRQQAIQNRFRTVMFNFEEFFSVPALSLSPMHLTLQTSSEHTGTDRQTDRQTGRHTHTLIHTQILQNA